MKNPNLGYKLQSISNGSSDGSSSNSCGGSSSYISSSSNISSHHIATDGTKNVCKT